MTSRICGNEYRLTTVCVDSYENGVLSGQFYNPHLETGRAFQSLTQFLNGMQDVLDAMNFPQSFTTTRTFAAPAKQQTGPPNLEYRSGKLATFSIRILFRQNSSWQGSIVWQEGGQEESFRSVLELIFLMDSALNSVKENVS